MAVFTGYLTWVAILTTLSIVRTRLEEEGLDVAEQPVEPMAKKVCNAKSYTYEEYQKLHPFTPRHSENTLKKVS